MPKAKTPPAGAPVIEFRPLDELIPYARNSRTHSDEQLAQIAAAMLEFGYTNPTLYDKDGIIAGHGRVLALSRIYKAGGRVKMLNGYVIPDGCVPCLCADGWSKAQRKAYIIADNKLAENAGWDMDLLKLEAADLNEMGYDLSLVGFSVSEIENLLAPGETEGLTDPDDIPPAPDQSAVETGDVWIMGNHRIICGDSTKATDVEALLQKVKPHLMVTDPPYGVDYDASWRDEQLGGKKGGRATGEVENDDQADWREAWALFPGDVAYVWHGMLQAGEVYNSLVASGFRIRAEIIWKKSQFVISRGHYHPMHESCFYAVKKTATASWAGDRKQTTVWEIDKPAKSETGHSTQKPVECMRRAIENNSSPGHAVYEPFSGSGTTIIAAEQTGRICYAVEINPVYVEVAILRWQAFTGQVATLESTGETFTEVMAKRTPNKSVGLKGAADKTKAKPAKKAAKKASKK